MSLGDADREAVWRLAPRPTPERGWREFVIGIKWATDNTGAVEVYARTPGASWTHVLERLHEPTYAYGTTSYGSRNKRGSNWPQVLDKIGLYFGGYSSTASRPKPFTSRA